MVTVKEAPPVGAHGAPRPGSFADAAQRAMPAVVNVFTSKEVKVAPHPFMEDPFFRRFFGDRFESSPQSRRASSLGSGVIVSPEGYILTNHHVIEAADEIDGLVDVLAAEMRAQRREPEDGHSGGEDRDDRDLQERSRAHGRDSLTVITEFG